MSRFEKLLDRMRNNPGGDWDINDIDSICRYLGMNCDPPRRGSHFTISHPKTNQILPIPAKRPLKPIYVKLFLTIVDSIMSDVDVAQGGGHRQCMDIPPLSGS